MMSHVEKPPSTVEFIIVFYLGEYTDGFVFGIFNKIGVNIYNFKLSFKVVVKM